MKNLLFITYLNEKQLKHKKGLQSSFSRRQSSAAYDLPFSILSFDLDLYLSKGNKQTNKHPIAIWDIHTPTIEAMKV